MLTLSYPVKFTILFDIPAGLQLRPAGGLLALVDPALPQQGGDRGQQGGEQQ